MLLPSYRLIAVLCVVWPLRATAHEFVQTGRYTVVAAIPTEAQVEPLAEVVVVRFPDAVATVGAAVRHLLEGTGYALSDSVCADADVFDFLGRPLPDVQRNLGPLTVFVALQTLASSSFRVAVDPVRRLIGLELVPDAKTGATTENQSEGA